LRSGKNGVVFSFFFFLLFLFGVLDVSDIKRAFLCLFSFTFCVGSANWDLLCVFRGLDGRDEEQWIVHDECYDL